MSNKKLVAAGVAVLVLVALVFGFLMWNKGGGEAEAGSPVSFTVNAEGWSEESSSPIPIQVTGETEDKVKVDEKYFLGASDDDLVLKPGTYEVEVYASPVNADGGMYRCPNAVKLSVPKSASKPQSKPEPSASASAEAVASVEFELSPVPANEITDEEIEKARAAMKEAGLSEEEINTFVEAVRNARQAELDRIEEDRQAEEQRKAQEQKAQEREAMGIYPGAGGPRPANAQPWPIGEYDLEVGAQMGNNVSGNPDMKILMCSGHWGSGVMCSNFAAENYPVRPNGDGVGSSPASTIYIDSGVIDYENISGLPVDPYIDVPVGQAWYVDNYVLGVTGSGVTVWDTNSGHGFFISNDGTRTETF